MSKKSALKYEIMALIGLNGLGYMAIVFLILIEGLNFFNWFISFFNLVLSIGIIYDVNYLFKESDV